MKKIFILSLISIALSQGLKAQTIVWTGTTSTDFFDATNWVGGVGYTGGEDILFNATGGSNNCNVTSNDISVASFSVMSGYTGVIDFGAQDHTIDNEFVINSGTVIGTSSGLSMLGTGRFELGASGTYSTNGGSFGISTNPGQSFTFAGNIVLNSLDINTSSNGSQRNVDFGTNLIVDDLSLNSLSGTNRPIAYQGTVHIKNSLTLNGTSTTTLTNNTANFIFDGASATINGAAATLRMPLPNIQINTVGTLDISGQVNVTGNWTGTQGTLNAGTSTVNFYGTSATINGPASAFDNLTIQTNASVTFPASAEVLVGRNFVSTGATVSFPTTSTLSFNGTTAQGITGPFTAGSIHVYAGSRTVTLNSAVILIDALIVDANATFAAGSNLTLRSNSSGTARVGASDGTITGSGIVVETHIPGSSTGWTNMGIRGVYNQQVQHWDTYVSSSGAHGLPMTCVGCAYSPTIIGTGSSSFVSIQDWNEAGDNYTELISTDPLNPGVGHWVYVGDGATSTADLRVINTGSLVQGNISVTMSSAGSGSFVAGFGTMYYNLVANPYPSPISATSLFGAINSFNFSGAIYVWNPDFSGGAGGYASFSGGVSTPGGAGAQTDVIPGGQGFYVEYQNLISTTLDFDETMKTDQNAPLLRPASDIGKIVRLKIAGANDKDETVFRIHSNATPGYDKKLDASKIFQSPGYAGYPGSYSKYTTISSKDIFGTDYSINSLPPLTQSLSIPVLARVSSTGTYSISAFDFQEFNMCVGLIDKLTNTYHDLRQSAYVCTINDTTSKPRFELVLCKDESLNQTGIAETNSWSNIHISQDQQGAFVKTAFPQNTKATISVYNLLGQKLMDDIHTEGTVNNTPLNLNLHNQVVIIRVSTEKESTTKKLLLN